MYSLRSSTGVIIFLFFSALHAQTLDSIPVCTLPRGQFGPKTTPSQGGAIAVWRDHRTILDDTTIGTIYAQFINKNGVSEWQPNGVPLFQKRVPSPQYSIVTDQQGGAFVARTDLEPLGSDEIIVNVTVQHIRRDGTLAFGSEGITIARDTSGNGYGLHPVPAVSSNAAGQFFVAWHSIEQGNTGSIIVTVAKVDSNGVVQWRLKNVNPTPGTYTRPSLVDDGSGGVLLLYVSFDEAGWRLKAQRIHNGMRMWDPAGVVIGVDVGIENSVDVASDGHKGIYVAWETYQAYAQHLDSNGVATWQNGGLPIVDGAFYSSRPSISKSSDGNVVIAVNIDAISNDSAGMVVNKISPEGTKLWGPEGIRVDWGRNYQRNPSIISTIDGGSFALFSTRPSGSTPTVLRCQFIGQNGELGLRYDVGNVSSRAPLPIEVSPHQHMLVWGKNRNIFATSVDTTGVTRAFISIPPDSIIVKSPITGKFLKPVKRKKHQFPNWANLFSETISHGGFQPGATESDSAGGMRVGHAYMVRVFSDSLNQKWKPNQDSAAVHSWARLTAWNFRKNTGKSAEALQKTLDNKGWLHNGPSHGFDSTGVPGQLSPKRKPLRGEQKTLDPRKTPNNLFAELVALKLGIAASQLGKTPRGFGELVYDVQGSPCDEMQIVEISRFADSVMTHWEGVPQIVFDSLYSAMFAINRVFAGALDTISFEQGGTLSIRGAVQVSTIPFIKNLSTSPLVLTPTSSGDADDEEELEGEGWESGDVPMVARVYQNYPNPFNPATTIRFSIPDNQLTVIKIFDILGQEVTTLVDETLEAGNHEVRFDASNLPSGVYFYRLSSGMFSEVKKMMMIK